MKKFILLLALFAAVVSKGQQTQYVNVYSVGPDSVHVGDSITIKFRVSTNSGGNTMARIQLWTSTYLQDCLYAYAGLYAADTNIVKVKIIQSMGSGNARIYSNLTPAPGYKTFYIKQQSVIGVLEFDKNSTVTNTEYYDVTGKEKTPISEGLSIKITTYSNGYQKREKVIVQQQ